MRSGESAEFPTSVEEVVAMFGEGTQILRIKPFKPVERICGYTIQQSTVLSTVEGCITDGLARFVLSLAQANSVRTIEGS